MKVSTNQAKNMLVAYLKANLTPMIVGSPGIGKSNIVYEIANEFNLKIIDLRLSQCDPCDLSGFPAIKNNKAGYVPMDTFPIVGDPIPEGYKGWLLFLDEFNGAAHSVQMASYKLILDKMIGQFHLHDNVRIVAAGNLETDNAIVNTLSTAMQSRLVHIEVEVDHKSWLDWALDKGINHLIIDYIKFKPSSLYTFKPDHSNNTYASPRTWEFVSKLLKIVKIDDSSITSLISGIVSEGVAREFLVFVKIYKNLPTLIEIISSPELTVVPVEPSHLFALTGFLSQNISDTNIDSIIKYINRLPVEFQIITLKEVLRKTPALIQNPHVLKWQTDNLSKFF